MMQSIALFKPVYRINITSVDPVPPEAGLSQGGVFAFLQSSE
jgi:hypothetical protein